MGRRTRGVLMAIKLGARGIRRLSNNKKIRNLGSYQRALIVFPNQSSLDTKELKFKRKKIDWQHRCLGIDKKSMYRNYKRESNNLKILYHRTSVKNANVVYSLREIKPTNFFNLPIKMILYCLFLYSLNLMNLKWKTLRFTAKKYHQ